MGEEGANELKFMRRLLCKTPLSKDEPDGEGANKPTFVQRLMCKKADAPKKEGE